ncbi:MULTISPECIES: tripartite tricarboxylate transporter TctB family protein [unclassified Nocardioides]|uniref:tripartite tricarboxylate transporter TctB family protein n=1 Tax=unclassified Nocardioides TaxID=2615069 RepID=UPI003014D82C
MTETRTTTTPDTATAGSIDRGQLGLAGALAVIGGYTVYDATTLDVGFADPVGPRVFPYVVGAVLLLLAVLLVVATLRGSRPEAEDGEDIDLTVPSDWTTVAKLVGVMVFTIATISVLGWAISGALLFAGSAWALGSATLIRDVLVGAVLAVVSWYGFYVGLGIPLSPGLLDGIL